MSELYPESRQWEVMKYWTLPKGREHELDELCTNGQYFAQEKKDGALYMFERTQNHIYLFGRNISKTTGELTEKSDRVPHIISSLCNLLFDTVLLGEIYYPNGESKDTASIMGALAEEAIKRQKERGLIHYYLFDILAFDGVDLRSAGFWDRYKILEAIYEKYNLSQYGYIDLAESFCEDIQQRLAEILAAGGEGIVLKKKNFPYQCGKRPAYSSCKVKKMDTIDLICCGFCSPTKEYTGKELNDWSYWAYIDGYGNEIILSSKPPEINFPTMNEEETYGDFKKRTEGIINIYQGYPITPITKYYYLGWNTAIKIGAYNDEGKLVELGTVSSGIDEALKQDMTEHPEKYYGKVCELSCMSIDKGQKTLRHPVFKQWRDDKNPKDCIISELFK